MFISQNFKKLSGIIFGKLLTFFTNITREVLLVHLGWESGVLL